MLKKGYLASTIFYASTEHSSDIINKYFEELDSVYKMIAQCERGELKIEKLLNGPICHSGFKRLN